ncbi:MAG TPA: VIT family protein [Steroidobacteraceae bacterium]|jgi:VIT1/CCC1 family predicted Fe2+/Mn2+ transporter|nr:VIT family protein [Steroidobacteraceae bacterium]
MPRHIFERHYVNRAGWLRAAVLGANDGIISVASLLTGVAATHASNRQMFVTGIAGLVAGAMSMAAGEYVSVSSQADSERSDLERERRELESHEEAERAELAGIYVQRGLQPALAREVALQLMAHDALGAHARDELGLSSTLRARPVTASAASASSFTAGAIWPLLLLWLAPASARVPVIVVGALLSLSTLGAVAARAGGASPLKGALRVSLWSALAMGLTIAIGALIGAIT